MWIADDIVSCMYHTGIDPFTKQEVYLARSLAAPTALTPIQEKNACATS